jgi:DNA-binding XRE family transcriptional regulator
MITSFPDTLKAHKARLGYSPQQMADALGVSLRTYHNWERGEAEAHVLAQEGVIARLIALPDPVPAKA